MEILIMKDILKPSPNSVFALLAKTKYLRHSTQIQPYGWTSDALNRWKKQAGNWQYNMVIKSGTCLGVGADPVGVVPDRGDYLYNIALAKRSPTGKWRNKKCPVI